MDSKKYKSYEFPTIEETFLQEKSISKYEIPQYIQDIPEGFSLFCTLWEASKVKQFIELNEEEKEKLGFAENEEKNKDDDILKEPIPKTKANFCHLCGRNFDDYLLHIETLIHKNNISKNQTMINTAKNTFRRINQFWNNKNNNNLNHSQINEKNEKLEKSEINKLYSTSNSSFSSTVSLYKYEENTVKDISSIIIDKDISDIDKNNDKENQSDNINKNIKHIRNKTNFITPIKKDKLLINKFSSHLSSSQSSLNIFINKKRKENNSITEEKIEKKIDYFTNLNTNNNKKLINGINAFFE